MDVFATRVKTEQLILPESGVLILWKWEVLNCDSMDVLESDESEGHDTEESTDTADDSDVSSFHTVTFKCIGATRSNDSQDALKKVVRLRDSGLRVPVNVVCEPRNPVDARAIAFQCKLGDTSCTIGYVVSEALDAVHSALRSKTIVNVRFGWVKYLVT